jgi:hypothetical protein
MGAVSVPGKWTIGINTLSGSGVQGDKPLSLRWGEGYSQAPRVNPDTFRWAHDHD